MINNMLLLWIRILGNTDAHQISTTPNNSVRNANEIPLLDLSLVAFLEYGVICLETLGIE